MSADLVVPKLSQLTENFITALYKQSDTANILDSFLFKDAQITVNGTIAPRQNFLRLIQTEIFLEKEADIKFLDIVEVDKSGSGAGSVGTFFTVTIFEVIKVRNVAKSHKITASLNVDFELNLTIPIPHPPVGVQGISPDQRRAKALNFVILDTPVPTGPVFPPGQ